MRFLPTLKEVLSPEKRLGKRQNKNLKKGKATRSSVHPCLLFLIFAAAFLLGQTRKFFMSHKGKVLVAMSGGIDSTITALMLHDEGYEV